MCNKKNKNLAAKFKPPAESGCISVNVTTSKKDITAICVLTE
jgi:hypothetical protein